MKLVVVFSLLLLHVKGELIGCGDRYDRSKWDCNDYKYHFAPANLDQTLYCIDFDKMVPLRRALNLSQPVPIKITDKYITLETSIQDPIPYNFKNYLRLFWLMNGWSLRLKIVTLSWNMNHLKYFPNLFPKSSFYKPGSVPTNLI